VPGIVLQNRLAGHCKSDTASQLTAIYGPVRSSRILLAAKDLDSVESKWRKIWLDELKSLTEWIIDKAQRTGQLDLAYVDFTKIAMEHSLDVMQKALDDSVDFLPEPEEARLAKSKAPPRASVPTSFRALRILWDKFRKKKYIPPRQRAIAERVKKAYLHRVQAEWVKHGDKFRSGEVAVRTEAVAAIMKGADVGYVRAKMIVETETTYYYNKTRRAVFDKSPDVSHYLFMAIRDHRTTEWCKSRHGLVYAKDDPLLKKEQPPVHWNCRSELLPLTELNPTHKKLIDDPARRRRNRKCKSLPPEWEGR